MEAFIPQIWAEHITRIWADIVYRRFQDCLEDEKFIADLLAEWTEEEDQSSTNV